MLVLEVRDKCGAFSSSKCQSDSTFEQQTGLQLSVYISEDTLSSMLFLTDETAAAPHRVPLRDR